MNLRAHKEISVDGVMRSRHDTTGRLLDHNDDNIVAFWRSFGNSKAVDREGRPLIFFHGTAVLFDQFSAEHHRTVLNDKYQGDAFHFSQRFEVGRKYAFASRNQLFNKARVFAAVDKAIPPDLAAVFKSVVERGHAATWDIPQSEVDAILGSATRAGIDLNDLLDLAEYVEGSNYHLGREQHFDASMIFGGSPTHFPDWARESADTFGLSAAAPAPRVVLAYLKCENPLRTADRAAARDAPNNGYDSVIFEGADLVEDEPEWAVFTPQQICIIASADNLHTDRPQWRAARRLTWGAPHNASSAPLIPPDSRRTPETRGQQVRSLLADGPTPKASRRTPNPG